MEFNPQNNLSKSKNSPWLRKKLKGKAIGVFNNGKRGWKNNFFH